MKSSWKKLVSSLLVLAILASQAGVASAGRFGSAVRKAAGAAVSSSGSGSGSSLVRRATGAVQKVTQGNSGNGGLGNRIVNGAKNVVTSRAGNVIGTAQEIVDNSDSLVVKVLAKAVTDPNSLTGRVVRRIDNIDSNSLTGKILEKAQNATNNPNSLTAKVLDRAKQAGTDSSSLTNRILNRAKVSVEGTNSTAGKIIDRAKLAVKDPTTPAGRIFDRAKLAAENTDKPAGKLFDRVKQAAAEAQEVVADAGNAAGAVAPVDVVNANQNGQINPLVGQLLSAGIQAGGQVIGSAIASRQQGVVVSGGGGFAPIAPAPEPIGIATVEEAAPATAPVATTDLELSDLRFVDNGNGEQGPLYRLMVKNLGNTKVTSEITVALLASMEKDSGDNMSVLGSLESLESGVTKTIDLRLPKGSQALTFLTAVVALSDAADANETDNVVTVETNSVRLAH